MGNKDRPALTPAELYVYHLRSQSGKLGSHSTCTIRCEILPNQPFRGKLNSEQTRKMLDVACLTPMQNQGEIMRVGLPALGVSPPSSSLQSLEIEIGGEMVTIPGRVLVPPTLEYRNKKAPQVRDGSWNLVGSKFNTPGRKLGACGALLLKIDNDNHFEAANDPELIKVSDFWPDRVLN